MRSMDTYCREMARHDLVSADDEKRLIAAYRNGDTSARDTLINANLRFVVGVARKYKRQGTPVEDIVQQGNMGLVRAVETFDAARGVRFLTYASRWVYQTITTFLERDRSVIKMPSSAIARAALRSYRRRPECTAAELAADADISLEHAEYYWAACAHPHSSGSPNEIPVEAEDEVANEHERAMYARALADAMRSLTPRERDVVERRIMAHNPETLVQIARTHGVTREAIRQNERRALSRLREALERQGVSAIEDLWFPAPGRRRRAA
jgi:RNA polymerase sigma-32 factor